MGGEREIDIRGLNATGRIITSEGYKLSEETGTAWQCYYAQYTNTSTSDFDSSAIDATLYRRLLGLYLDPYTEPLLPKDLEFSDTRTYQQTDNATMKSTILNWTSISASPTKGGAIPKALTKQLGKLYAKHIALNEYIIAKGNHAFTIGTTTTPLDNLVACARIPYVTLEDARCG